jgi:conjugal transfer pilus assembly protein TraB
LDVSTSIKTASDPEPVLIRVTNFGTLPRKFSSDLKDCHIVGSAYGDLSSERAKIRIEKLSCVEIKTAEVVETEIAGYVSGEDGRAGLRGIIVSVDQKYMVNAQIFGTLGGLASSSTPSPTSYNPFTVASGAVRPQSAQQNLTSGLLNGASNSLDKISDYYIDRAESIQPVVQVAAGREIDIIFTEGVYFGTSNLKRSISQKRDEKMRQTGEMDQFQLDHSRPEQSKSNKLNLSGE